MEADDKDRCTMAFFAAEIDAEVVAVESDPVVGTLNEVAVAGPVEPRLLRGKDGKVYELQTLDGIGYEVSFANTSLSGRFRFANPYWPPLVTLERELFRLAELVQERRPNEELGQYVATWRGWLGQHSPQPAS